MLFRGKGDRAKKSHESAEYKIFSPLLCQLSYLALIPGDKQTYGEIVRKAMSWLPKFYPDLMGSIFSLPLRLDLRRGSFSPDNLTGWHC
jgi:hypothetical protein